MNYMRVISPGFHEYITLKLPIYFLTFWIMILILWAIFFAIGYIHLLKVEKKEKAEAEANAKDEKFKNYILAYNRTEDEVKNHPTYGWDNKGLWQ